MDSNLFEYLIIIFFIVTALQSMFGKKKKQRKQQEQREQQRRQESYPQRSTHSSTQKERGQESPKDIFEEMFGFKLPDEKEKQTKTPSDRETEVLDPAKNNETTWRPEEEYEDSIGIETVRYADTEDKKSYKYQEKMAALERKAEKSKRMIDRLPAKMEVVEVGGPTVEQKRLAERIKNTVRDPETLREYILVSELLNKPRALRR
ncbi:MAG: hypothetical protein U5K00_03770 [Melioribacteraceae bacterium]|nr:hypothetical protein [Melioribacteraceae bacterium]